jgi:dTDP-4-dehydrorhamnose 3,5-epimerase-like enzyme
MVKKLNCKLDYSTRRRDERGFLVDFLKADELKGEDKIFGQMYFVTFEKPGAIRGNHFHKEKKEWFVVGQGKILVVLENIKTKARETLILDGDDDRYVRLMVGENIAHAFVNLTPFAYLVNYCNKPYHNKRPDSPLYELIKEVKNGKTKKR